ncbi:hypothetical protein LWI29_005077 [Acer saccharum]|uniref:asparagine--tRNA ligase n=1 Tax=Acer saccharum TaxID=4024 RepID=A0AA39SCE4_ACESA|nr:hypothetical protein LWI29_005077 [Acer saccharum]
MDSPQENTTPTTLTSKYSNRVLIKNILEPTDGGNILFEERVIIGGWVKSSKEVKKEPLPPPPTDDHDASSGPKEKDVSCVEILQSRIPFFRTIIRVLAGTAGGANGSPLREKLESIIPKPPPPPSTLFLQVSDGSCVASLQVVVESAMASPGILQPTGTCIWVEGTLKQPSMEGKRAVELRAEKILHVGKVDQDKYPLSRKRLPLETLRDSAHFRPRTTTVAAVMRIRNALTFASHTFFQNNGFLYVQVPVITTTDSEGCSEKFHVTTLIDRADKEDPNTASVEGVSLDAIKSAIKEKSNLIEELKRSDSNKEALFAAEQDIRKTNELASQLEARQKSKKLNTREDFFSCQAYLTVSGRLHLESYACALGNVYSFGPRFRAEKSQSPKCVAEMWMVEVEMAFSQLEDAMNCAEDYFKFLCKWVVENCPQDMEFVSKRIYRSIIDRLKSIISTSSEKVTYTEAVGILEKVTEKEFEIKLEWGVALTTEHLSYLADEIYKGPVIIYDYPKAAKPFYARLNDDGKTVAAFDMVLPKVGRLITGNQNEERVDMLATRIKELGLAREQYEWYMDLRRHGSVKHSGFSLGFDLMLLYTTGLTDVRDRVIIGGWVKSSKEVKKEPLPPPPPPPTDDHDASSGPKEKDVSCVEILQSRIPFFRTIIRVLAGTAGGANGSHLREKLESIIPKPPPPPSTLFLQVSDGSCVASLKVVVESAMASPGILQPTETCIWVEGTLKQPSMEGKRAVELRAEKILHVGKVDQDKYPLSSKQPLETLMDSAHFRPRITTVASVMRIRNALTFASHTFFQNNGFLYVQVHVITTTDSEGCSEKFHVTTLIDRADKEDPNTASVEGVSLDVIKSAIKEKSNLIEELKRSDSNKEALFAAEQDIRKINELASQLEERKKSKKLNTSEDFFSCQAYLTVSGRLHLESYACALGNVYSFGPRFRAEKSQSPKCVAEMWMVEVEMAFSQLEDAMNCAEDYFKFLCKWVVENCPQDMEFVSKQIDRSIIDRLKSIISTSSEKVTYTEAVGILEKVTEKEFEIKLEWGVALTTEHLSYLADEIYKGPVIIYDYPKAAKPFYARLNDDGKTVAAFDMVLPKVGRLITGNQNEERVDMLATRIKELGLAREQYEWYMDLRRHGSVKHSGFSLGFDLMLLYTTGLTDVRDVIPFPASFGKANN